VFPEEYRYAIEKCRDEIVTNHGAGAFLRKYPQKIKSWDYAHRNPACFTLKINGDLFRLLSDEELKTPDDPITFVQNRVDEWIDADARVPREGLHGYYLQTRVGFLVGEVPVPAVSDRVTVIHVPSTVCYNSETLRNFVDQKMAVIRRDLVFMGITSTIDPRDKNEGPVMV
jgi:hypothetical protein